MGSKLIAAGPGSEWSASTIRAELASLEDRGFLSYLRGQGPH